MNAEIWATLKARKLGLGTPILEVLMASLLQQGATPTNAHTPTIFVSKIVQIRRSS